MRFAFLVGVLSLGGCQCLEPVAEVSPDAGRDGGVDAGRADAGPIDAGTDAGPAQDGGGPACTTVADCVGGLPSQSLCSFSADAGFSCIQERCVFECTKGRSCGFDAGPAPCLSCALPSSSSCAVAMCGFMATMQGQVESSTCTVPFTAVMLQPENLGGCSWSVTDATGTRGVINFVNGQYVGRFAGLGTCVGVSLFTQVERLVFSCEGCQFVLRL